MYVLLSMSLAACHVVIEDHIAVVELFYIRQAPVRYHIFRVISRTHEFEGKSLYSVQFLNIESK